MKYYLEIHDKSKDKIIILHTISSDHENLHTKNNTGLYTMTNEISHVTHLTFAIQCH